MKNGLTKIALILSLTLAASFMTSSAWAQTAVVVPAANTNVEGDVNNAFPYDIAPALLTAQRYHQIYAASEFGGVSGLITQLRFRPDGVSGAAFAATLPNVQIVFSVTPVTPATLSAVYANNFGPSQTTVFSGALSLSSANTGPAGGPKSFDIVINLQTPFFYNPAQGNLLMEVKNFVGVTTAPFDAVTSLVVNRVHNIDNNPNGTTGILRAANIGGLVTQFIIAPVESYQVSYASNLVAGDSYVDLTNSGANVVAGASANICVNVYTFDPSEELVSCCACPVTPNGLNSLSVKQDLVSNTLTPGVPGSVVIKLLATTGATCNASNPAVTTLTGGLLAWDTTLTQNTSTGTFETNRVPFSTATLSTAELARLATFCGFIQANGSGFGICRSCRIGALGGAQQ